MPFRSLRFLEPDAAYWLLLLPLLWCCWLLHRWYRDGRRRASGIGPRLADLALLTGVKRDLAVLALATLGGAALVSAAARPQAIVWTPQYESMDLILVLDRSASMLATDVKPSRFSRASLEIQNFLQNKPDTIDRVGLITFAGSAIVSSHLTRDLDILFFFLDWMKDDPRPFYGTDVATALESALNVARTQSPERRKVVVLLSDGEDHGERLDRTIDEFHDSGIAVYSIGVGGEDAVTMPAPLGSYYPTLRDDDSNEMTTTFNETTLRRIATMTNGRYFRSTTGLELATTLAEVAAREKRATQFREEYRDIDGYALAAAALLLSGLLVLL
jgi:Ca-activated chloride channel family protein